MKIHSDTITASDMIAAVQKAGNGVAIDFTRKGSRSRKNAFEFSLTGTSNRRPNSGQRGAGDDYAATWDEWGIVLAHLFSVDPNATATYYKDADDFHFQTDDRFRTLTPDQQCKDHKWDFVGYSVTGESSIRECRKCGARTNRQENWG